MLANRMSFTEQAKTDKALRSKAYSIIQDVRENGIPKTLEGLQEMYLVYNLVYGKRKVVNNCIRCRKNVAEYLEKSVQLLDMEPKKPKTKPAPKKIVKVTPKAKAKPTTRKRKPTTKKPK